MSVLPLEKYSPLSAVAGLAHAFSLRQPGVEVLAERDEVVQNLRPAHGQIAQNLGFSAAAVVCGEQVHGGEVALADTPTGFADPIPGVDGFVSATPGVLLGIYVADCCAVFLGDRRGRAVGLVHSGKKGTELGIAPRAIEMLGDLGAPAEDLIVQLSPCIRPPLYEVDFAAQIRADCASVGVPEAQIFDDLTCTGQDLERYYSYRVEKGRTGRMLALLGINA